MKRSKIMPFDAFSTRLDEELSPELRNKAAIRAGSDAIGNFDNLKTMKAKDQKHALLKFPPHVESLAKKAAEMIVKDYEKYEALTNQPVKKGSFVYRAQKMIDTQQPYSVTESDVNVHFWVTILDTTGKKLATVSFMKDGILKVDHYVPSEKVFTQLQLSEETVRVLERLLVEMEKDMKLPKSYPVNIDLSTK